MLGPMVDHGRAIEFGVDVTPNADNPSLTRMLLWRVDTLGFELLGVQGSSPAAAGTPG